MAELRTHSICASNAKYALLVNDTYYFVCHKHAIKMAYLYLNHKYESVNQIPSLIRASVFYFNNECDTFGALSPIIKSGISELQQITNLDLQVLGELPPLLGMARMQTNLEGWILEVCTNKTLINDLLTEDCIHVKTKKLEPDLFVPIYTSNGRHLSKLRDYTYYVQLRRLYYPFDVMTWTDVTRYAFVEQMCILLERLHNVRICHGNMNHHTLGFLDKEDPSSVRLVSPKGITFWRDGYGRYIPETRAVFKTKMHRTASIRSNMNSTTCRYDDFESLLYLLLDLQCEALPWNNLKTAREIIRLKKEFISNPDIALSNHPSIDSIKQICQLIELSSFDSMPSYKVIGQMFKRIALYQ